MSRTLSADVLRAARRGTGLVWLVFFAASFFQLWYLLPVPIVIGVFAVTFLRHAPSRDAAYMGAGLAAVIGLISAGLIAISPHQELVFAQLAALSFGTAAYTAAAAALAAPQVALRDAH